MKSKTSMKSKNTQEENKSSIMDFCVVTKCKVKEEIVNPVVKRRFKSDAVVQKHILAMFDDKPIHYFDSITFPLAKRHELFLSMFDYTFQTYRKVGLLMLANTFMNMSNKYRQIAKQLHTIYDALKTVTTEEELDDVISQYETELTLRQKYMKKLLDCVLRNDGYDSDN